MKIVGLSGSIVGSKTRTAMDLVIESLQKQEPDAEVVLLDLADYKIPFSDGRHYMDYEGDAKFVAQSLMGADAIIFGSPVFQASIPGTLKNVFDLLPQNALRDKVTSVLITAGSAKHYLVAEHHLKPILNYMKAHIVPTYVFIEDQDFHRKELINDDARFRIERLVEDTLVLTKTYQEIHQAREAEYDF